MHRKILRLALPNIISNITVPLLGLVDLAVVGHLGEVYYIGAVAIGTTIFNFLYWGFGFLRMSTSGLAAQAYGANDRNNTAVILQRTSLISLGLGVGLLILQYPVAELTFTLFHGSPEAEQFARSYFNIRIWAAPATLLLYSFNGWFLGMQNARYTMYITLVINLLNIGFDFFFVYVAGMHSDGVALGTVLANYAGLLVGFGLLIKKYRYTFRFHSVQVLLNKTALRKLFFLNTDIFIRTACLIAIHTFFTARSARSGDDLLAVNILLLQFFMFFSYLIDGFAFAAEALTGRFLGAGRPDQLRKGIITLFLWGMMISIPFSLAYFTGGTSILTLLTNNPEIINLSRTYLFWLGIVPLISFPAFLWDGIYIGATASAGMRNTMLVSTLIFFFPVYYLSQGMIHNHALWLALIMSMISRGISMTITAKKYIFAPHL
jgi:multidrug resistance protein, MATE family